MSETTNKSALYRKLGYIQTNLKAPKNLYNRFGKYNYRNAEGILEAVKPLLAEQGCVLIIEDSIEVIGEDTATKSENGVTVTKTLPRRYIKATAHLIDCESGIEVNTSAYANECEHTGMSGDQCTGTASSYARKYCLNALFLLDDTKDSDTDEMKNIEDSAKQNNNANNAPAPASNAKGGWNKGNSAPANNAPAPAPAPAPQQQAQYQQKPAKNGGSWGKPANNGNWGNPN